jgi:hypothetical protein
VKRYFQDDIMQLFYEDLVLKAGWHYRKAIRRTEQVFNDLDKSKSG